MSAYFFKGATKLTCIVLIIVFDFAGAQEIEVLNPLFHFPGGSDPFQGIILAIDLPLDTGGYADVHFSLLYEAAYVLPTNETRFEYPPLITTRKFIYEMIEEKFKSYGYPGKDCLLRMICEASDKSPQHTGVLGDLVHIILTPSTSVIEEFLHKDYGSSEKYGRKHGQCQTYQSNCSFSLLNKISELFF